MIYPLLVAVVSGLFAAGVIRDYRARRKPYQALWSASLTMSCLGSLAYVVAAQFGSAAAFKLYYLLGALLVAPYTGMGSLYLAMRPERAKVVLWAVHAVSLLGTVLLLGAPVDAEALAALAGSSGRGVLESGAWLAAMIVLNVFGTVAVVGVAVYSVIKGLRKGADRGMVAGNALIGLGFLLVAMAGSVARWWPDWDGGFWVTMAIGWAVAFFGFRSVTAAAERRSAAVQGGRRATSA